MAAITDKLATPDIHALYISAGTNLYYSAYCTIVYAYSRRLGLYCISISQLNTCKT